MFVEVITEKMKKNKITQKKLCKDIGIKETTFTGWKNGKQPRLETAIEVFRYLDISVDELYGLKEKKLTEDEEELIEMYRKIDLKSKDMIKAAIKIAAEEKSYTSEETNAG